MVKEWFTHEYGFVNIDTENIYFTNTGNWSETKDLEEKGLQEQNSFRQFRMKIIPFILIAVAVFLLIFPIDSGKVKFSLITGLVVLAISARKYLKTEISSKFKLPISKVKSITLNNKTAIIIFQNGKGKQVQETLENLDQKGIDLLEELTQKKL
jgi:hypothetical protein